METNKLMKANSQAAGGLKLAKAVSITSNKFDNLKDAINYAHTNNYK
jgi:hypothetical protein